MARRVTIGFPRMNKESGEKRVFLPAFIQFLTQFADVYLEEGYGSRSGFTFDDYRQGNSAVYITDRLRSFQKDYVIVLRSPMKTNFPSFAVVHASFRCCTTLPAPGGCKFCKSWVSMPFRWIRLWMTEMCAW